MRPLLLKLVFNGLRLFQRQSGAAVGIGDRKADQRGKPLEIRGKNHAHTRFGEVGYGLFDGGSDVIQVAEHSNAIKTDDLDILRHPQSHGTQHADDLVGDRISAAEQSIKGKTAILHVATQKVLKAGGIPSLSSRHS